MSTQYAFGKIVTNGLVLALDAADRNSYTSGSLTWFDLSGKNYNGTFSGSSFPSYSTGSGGTLYFYATSSFINFNSTSIKTNFNSLSAATLETWINVSSSVTSFIIGFNPIDNSSGNRFSIVTNGTTIYFQIENGSASYPSCPAIGDNKWMHIVLSYNGSLTGLSRIAAYVNAVPQSLTSNGTLPASSMSPTLSDFNIGTLLTTGRYGTIAQVKAYNRTLSQDEILQNYNAQKARFGLT